MFQMAITGEKDETETLSNAVVASNGTAACCMAKQEAYRW